MVDVAKTNAKTFAHEHEQGKIDYTLDHQVTEKEGAKAATEGSNASANKEGEQLEEGQTNEMMNDDVPAHKEEGESASEGGGSVHEGEGGVSGAGGEGGDSEKPAGKDKDASSGGGDEKGSGESAPRLISTKPANPRKLDRLDVPLERSASSTSAAVVSSTKKSTEAYVLCLSPPLSLPTSLPSPLPSPPLSTFVGRRIRCLSRVCPPPRLVRN